MSRWRVTMVSLASGPITRSLNRAATSLCSRPGVLLMLPLVLGSCDPTPLPPSVTNSLDIEMVLIPGTPPDTPDQAVDPFYLATTEVTNAQYEQFDPSHRELRDRYAPGDDHPVVRVSRHDALAFTRWLSAREHASYRLPSEAEWQWAAQAGLAHHAYGTADGTFQPHLVNAAGTNEADHWEHAAPVASFAPNPFGLYDMSGNVWEWTSDWFRRERTLHRVWLQPSFLPRVRIPIVWYTLPKRWGVVRGGSYAHEEPLMRTTVRNAYRPGTRSRGWGFRLALSADQLPVR